jgi:hypothetical protein
MKKALLIGINYTGSKYELGGCINDINNIQNFIIENCEYKIENTTKLTDETTVKPTLQNVKDSIYNLVKNTVAGDSLLFYYSGHGSQIENDNEIKIGDDLDEVLVPLDYKKSGFITDVWLYDNLVKIIPKDVTLWCFTDCCHSGTMLNLQYNLVYNRKKQNIPCRLTTSSLKVETGLYNEDDWINKYTLFLTNKKIETEGDVFMFSGCLDEQTSADLGDRGAFTNALLETLGNYKDKNRKIIDILKEIDCRLNVNDFTQIPQLSIGNLDDIHKDLVL